MTPAGKAEVVIGKLVGRIWLAGVQIAFTQPIKVGDVVVIEGEWGTIGEITSGCFGPTVGGPVAMGYVSAGHGEPGEKVKLIIRGKAHDAEIVALPFVTQNYKR